MTGLAELLTPRPRQVRATGAGPRWAARPTVALAGEGGERAMAKLVEGLAGLGLEARRVGGDAWSAADFRLASGEAGLPGQGYRLRVGEAGVELAGADRAGLFYGVTTLLQWLRLHDSDGSGSDDSGSDRRVLGLEVRDHPDLPHRGVLLDVSRNKVPTMATLRELIDRLAGWKINQLQLYTEHTFAYRGHERVWRGASPITPEEVRELDRYAAERFVELVPNQNSFGHLHRWLQHAPYRELAECPEGVEHPFSDEREPFSLCPVDPRALELVDDLMGQLLPNFSSRQVNIGFDETFDLGRGRSATACAERGTGRVYLEYLQAVAERAARDGFRVQLWADMLLEHPELLGELPQGALPLVWGYEAGHPFASASESLAGAGLEFYLCPGTSSWLSFAGRWPNALVNLAEAALAAADHGASGYLITDWGDFGHLQPLAVSYMGLLAGAAFAWNAGEARAPLDHDWPARLDRWALHMPGLGAIARELGTAYLSTGAEIRNGTVLGRLLLSAGDDLTHPRYEALTAEGLERAVERVERARERLAELTGGKLALRELDWSAAALETSAHLGLARLAAGRAVPLSALPSEARGRLHRAVEELIDRLEPLWLARNRPGGLADSRARLERVASALG